MILVRHGELALKSPRVRARLMGLLRRRIEEALERAGVEGIVQQVHGRHLVQADDLDAAARAVSRVFGITSLSVATLAPVDLEGLEQAAAEYARTHWPKGARSFAVRSRRTGSHPYTSQSVAKGTGSAVWRAMEAQGVDVRVDLDDPDWALFVEVRNKQAFLYHDRVEGQGGLPLGSQGRVVVWLTDAASGVAAWLMMRRGAQIVPFYLPEVAPSLDGPVHEGPHVAQRVHEVLRLWGASKRLHAVRLDQETLAFLKEGEDSVALARFAVRQGLELADNTRAHALVTPETRDVPWALRLPEVHQGGGRPVLRPLMGLGRETIERYRRRVGLPEDSRPQHRSDGGDAEAGVVSPGAREGR